MDDRDEVVVVVINGEGQHALWPDEREVPPGWRIVMGPAPKAECLEYVRAYWTDITPLGLRTAKD